MTTAVARPPTVEVQENTAPAHWTAFPAQFRWRLLFARVDNGDLNGFKELYRQDPTLINHRGSGGESLLHRAVPAGNWDLCKFLLEKGCDPHHAAKYNSEEPWTPFDVSTKLDSPLLSYISGKETVCPTIRKFF